MTDLHKAAQQALEALDSIDVGYRSPSGDPLEVSLDEAKCEAAIAALRAALAQERAGSWQDGVLEGHLRERERWLAQEPDLSRCPQCNGPADNGHDRSIPPNPYLCTKCMAEMPQPTYNVTVVDDAHPNGIPLEQWQNKPVEPVDVGLLEYRGNSVAFIHQKMTAYRTGIDAAWDAFRANGLHPDGKTSLADMIAKYTAPPQRKPLTEEETDKIFKHLCNTVGASYKTMTRAVEQAHGIKE